MTNELVKGAGEYTGNEAVKRQKIKGVLAGVFELYGFELAETPIIEYEDFVRGENSNDEAVSDIFKLEDKGKRKLALRYEFTFQLKRLAQNKKLPYKRYQIGPVFRDEPTSENRFRQFTQCDADVVGSTIKDEAEILAMAKEAFDKLGINVIINVNNRKLLNEILEKQNISDKFQVIKELDKLDKLSEKEVYENLKKYNAENVLEIFKNKEKDFENYTNYGEIKELKAACLLYGININFVPFLARGLSYYNGTIFEIKTKEMKETVCAGGSYLVNGIQSTGMSFGLERLFQLAKINPANEKVLIISLEQDKKAIDFSKELRKKNISCSVMFGKPSKALNYANAYEIENVIFIGEQEIIKKKYKLRNMFSGKEEFLSEEELLEKF